MWLLPTKNNLPNLRRFLNAAIEMGTSTPGIVIVNESEWRFRRSDYEALLKFAPAGWSVKAVKAETYGDALRAVWGEIKHLEWVGLVADDHIPATPNWDRALIAGLKGWNLISSNDGWQANADVQVGRIHGAIAFSGELVRTVGWLFPDGLNHIFHDDMWETLGRETRNWSCRMDVMVRHEHAALRGVIGPTMTPTSDLWKHDEAIYRKWLADEKPTLVAKIRALMDRYQVRQVSFDFTGVNLFIGTPTASGRYESSFMVSWYETLKFLKDHNVPFQFAEEKYTADISLARNKLISVFLSTPCTHMMMIDDDMGWRIDALIRLFHARKDFVSIAGPKKKYPLQFAANHADDNNNPILMQMDSDSGTMEVSEIGSAFCLMTKECAVKMLNAYPELRYDGILGEPSFAPYIPLIRKRRWYSEDYAFCRRWRDIGGKVYLIPDVPLSHTGAHTFHGAFIDAHGVKRGSDIREAAE